MNDVKPEKKLKQAIDFFDESNELYELIKDLSDKELNQKTGFKNWTINEIIAHLHIWNMAADMSLNDPEGFQDYIKVVNEIFESGGSIKDFERVYLSATGRELLDLWHYSFIEIADSFSKADPKARVKWAGPDMSVRSSITARLMETWAHGQAIYDVLGVVRKNTDRIENIAVLGVITYPYTYRIRHEELPGPMPFVKLTAPSGKLWLYGDVSETECIEGLAEEFCQVVTQTRNIADTKLRVTGDIAHNWMNKAQCFAGGPETPPSVGRRKIKIREL